MYFGGNHRWVPLRLANKVLDIRVTETVAAKTILNYFRPRVVPHFSSGIVERAKRSRGVIFTRARVSLALLSLRKNEGLLVVYNYVNCVSNLRKTNLKVAEHSFGRL